MRDWELRFHGDHLEQKWGEAVCHEFPNYELYWRVHIVPLTSRPNSIHADNQIPRRDRVKQYHP